MIKNKNIFSLIAIFVFMFCSCYNANALTEKTKEDDSKNISGVFVENQDVFYEKINSVMAKKQIDKTITKYLKIKEEKAKEEKRVKKAQNENKEESKPQEEKTEPTETIQKSESNVDYMIIADGGASIPDDWDENISLVEATNIYGGKYLLEEKTYKAFLLLRESLLLEGVDIEIDSARRTWEEQLALAERFRQQYGQEYVDTYFSSTPGEHATGLAIDLCIDKNGVRIDENEDMLQETEIFSIIHSKLADYGFILSYPEGHSFTYEPWHIRYIDDPDAAKAIMISGITLREYLGGY